MRGKNKSPSLKLPLDFPPKQIEETLHIKPCLESLLPFEVTEISSNWLERGIRHRKCGQIGRFWFQNQLRQSHVYRRRGRSKFLCMRGRVRSMQFYSWDWRKGTGSCLWDMLMAVSSEECTTQRRKLCSFIRFNTTLKCGLENKGLDQWLIQLCLPSPSPGDLLAKLT